MTVNHGYNTPSEGTTDWHVPLNDNFEMIDADVEVRDVESEIDQYDPTEGAKFLATDTGGVFLGDGSQWVNIGSIARSGEGDGVPNNFVNVLDHGAAGDGVTDDTQAVQDAIDSQGGPFVLYFPEGKYLTHGWTLPSDVHVVGEHPHNTVIFREWIDGSTSNSAFAAFSQDNITIQNMTVRGDWGWDTLILFEDDCRNLTVRDVNTFNNNGSHVQGWGSDNSLQAVPRNVYVENVTARGGADQQGNPMILWEYARDVTVHSCEAHDAGHESGFSMGGANINLINCRGSNLYGGVRFEPHDRDAHNNRIIGGEFRETGGGVFLYGKGSVDIVNVACRWNTFGIRTHASASHWNIRMYGPVCEYNDGPGINLEGDCRDIEIYNAHCRNNGQRREDWMGWAERAGLRIGGTSENVIVQGGRYADDQSTPTQGAGVMFYGGEHRDTTIRNVDARGNEWNGVTFENDPVLIAEQFDGIQGWDYARSSVPSEPYAGLKYLDDGSNRSDGSRGYRMYDGSQWHDL